MAGGIDWFRWHHGSVTDPKFQLVARKSGTNLPTVLAVWAYVLETASQATERGTFEIDAEALDCLFALEDGATAKVLAAMQERGLLGDGRVCSWDKRQPKREDDTAAERKRRQRERDHEIAVKEKSVTVTESRDVTQSHADVTHGHDRGEERRVEKRYSVAKATGVPPDEIFGDGLGYLVGKGIPERSARSFLGKMRKALNDDLVAVELLTKAQQLEVSDPVPWLRAAAQKRMAPSRLGGSNGVAL